MSAVAWVQTKLAIPNGKRKRKIDALVSDQVRGVALQCGEWADFERDKDKDALELQYGYKPVVIETGAALGPVLEDLERATTYALAVSQLHAWGAEPVSLLVYARMMRMWWEASGKEMPAATRARLDEIESRERAA